MLGIFENLKNII